MSEIRPWSETITLGVIESIPGGSLITRIGEQFRLRHAAAFDEWIARINGEVPTAALGAALEEPIFEATFARAADAVLRTGLDAKRRYLARVIAQAVEDDAKVDEASLLVDALADIDAPHVRALERLRLADDEATRRGLEREERDEFLKTTWLHEPIPVRAALVRVGCSTGDVVSYVQNGDFYAHSPEAITQFGRQLLANLREFDIGTQVPIANE